MGKASPRQPRPTPRPTARAASPPRLLLPPGGLSDGEIRLRAPRDADAAAIARGCGDAEVARWTNVPSPYTLEDARAWIAMAAVLRERGSELHLVVARVDEDRVVGSAALRLREGPDPHGDVGYWVAAAARRRGIGTRAVRLLARHGLESAGLAWIEIAVSPRNEASQRLAASAGFERCASELREFRGRLEEFVLFRLS